MTALEVSSEPATVKIGRRSFAFTSFEQVSAAYSATIGAMDYGASRTPSCKIFDASGKQVAYVSYNGRVWAGEERGWKSGNTPLYAPNGFYGDPQDLPRVGNVPQIALAA